MRIESLYALGRSGFYNHPPVTAQRRLHQPRQYLFQRLTLQMVEEDFCHVRRRRPLGIGAGVKTSVMRSAFSLFVMFFDQPVEQPDAVTAGPAFADGRFRRPHSRAGNIEMNPRHLISEAL